MAGYWLNPDTGKCVQVETTHDEWVRSKNNAEAIGLPKAAYDAIMRHPAKAIDEIRLLALRGGLVRIREHPRHVSVQFTVSPDRLPHTLDALITALRSIKMRPEVTLKIDNLLTNESANLGLNELVDKLDKGVPLFEADQ